MSAAIRHFETVTSHTLNISVPDEFLNRRVEVVVSLCENETLPLRRPREVSSHQRPAGDFLATIDASCCGVDLASLTGDDLRFQYLTEKLGPVDSERFIVLLNREPFDYTHWRDENLFAGMTLDEVNDAAEKHWETLL